MPKKKVEKTIKETLNKYQLDNIKNSPKPTKNNICLGDEEYRDDGCSGSCGQMVECLNKQTSKKCHDEHLIALRDTLTNLINKHNRGCQKDCINCEEYKKLEDIGNSKWRRLYW